MNGVTILQGDVREVLKTLPDESVNCVVTSPPYWGLRDYGIPPSVWGGDPECAHKFEFGSSTSETNYTDKRRWQHTRNGRDELQPVEKRVGWLREKVEHGEFCRCGAWLGAHGLEPTLRRYVENEAIVFAEVWRVLRADGTLWLNLGDSYNSGNKGNSGEMNPSYKQATNAGSLATRRGEKLGGQRNGGAKDLCKPKDLCGIPWRVAFALQEWGWYLRADIIWSKPNPMPESVRDRPTKAHEYLFLLSKSERYYYDFERVLEPVTGNAHARGDGVNPKCYNGSSFTTGKTGDPRAHANVGQGPRKAYKMPDGWDTGEGGHGKFHRNGREKGKMLPRPKQNESLSAAVNELVEARNKRSVWTVPTQPTPEAHFATFPEELIKPCILAGCPAGGTVLDPFFGTGTTGLVARANGCKCIGIELNKAYIEIAKKRLSQNVFEFDISDNAADSSLDNGVAPR